MSDKNDNLFGGMFDINGDGKTNLVEKYLEYNYLEEAAKSQESPTYRRRPSYIAPLEPESITPEKYNSRIKDFIVNCVSSIFSFIILCSIPCIVMWAAVDTYDPKSSVSGVLTTIIIIVGAFFIIALFSALIGVIRESYNNMKKVKELYEEMNRRTKEE